MKQVNTTFSRMMGRVASIIRMQFPDRDREACAYGSLIPFIEARCKPRSL